MESIAEKYKLPVTLLCDTNHVLSSDYSEVMIVGAGADAVDFKLISLCHPSDIVVTQDYGVAAMALGKKARKGSSKNHLKGPRKRTAGDDERFAEAFERLIKKVME